MIRLIVLAVLFLAVLFFLVFLGANKANAESCEYFRGYGISTETCYDAQKNVVKRVRTAGKYSSDERIQRKIERMYKKAEERKKEIENYQGRASELADKMDIPFDPKKDRIYLEGSVPTIINGQNVPLKFLTDEERRSVERARKIKESQRDKGERR